MLCLFFFSSKVFISHRDGWSLFKFLFIIPVICVQKNLFKAAQFFTSLTCIVQTKSVISRKVFNRCAYRVNKINLYRTGVPTEYHAIVSWKWIDDFPTEVFSVSPNASSLIWVKLNDSGAFFLYAVSMSVFFLNLGYQTTFIEFFGGCHPSQTHTNTHTNTHTHAHPSLFLDAKHPQEKALRWRWMNISPSTASCAAKEPPAFAAVDTWMAGIPLERLTPLVHV